MSYVVMAVCLAALAMCSTCSSLLTYTTCGVWLSSSSLCESVSSMLMDSSGVLRWIPSIWSSGDVHPGW